MRRIKLLIFPLLLSFSLLTLAITVRVGFYDNYPLCYEKNGKAHGFYIEILNYIAKEENWKLEYIYDKWTVLLEKLKRNEIDMLVAIAYTPERENLFDFNEENFINNWGVVISRKYITNLFDLKNKTVALVKKDVYAEKFVELIEKFHVENVNLTWVDSYEEAIKLLRFGVVNAAVVSRLASVIFSNKYSYIETPIIFKPVELKLAFPKNSSLKEFLIPTVDSYLSSLKENSDSVYWKAMEKYIMKNEKFRLSKRVATLLKFIGVIIVTLIGIIFFLRRIILIKTKELQQKNKELQRYTKELFEVNSKLQELNMKFSNIIDEISRLATHEIPDSEFLRYSLSLVAKNIPSVELGSIFLLEKDRWKVAAIHGDDIKIFENLKIKKDDINLNDDGVFMKDPEEMLEVIPEELKDKYLENLKNSGKIVVSPLKNSEKTFGFLTLSIGNFKEREINLDALQRITRVISAFYTLRNLLKQVGIFHKNVALAVVKALELHSVYTKGHSERVANLSAKIAEELTLPKSKIKQTYWAALLHDIGKIGIPSNILEKPSRLSPEEFEIVKMHPIWGWEILKEINGMEEIARIVRHHHERFDGKGYPDGLSDGKIPLISRIIAVADTYDAMTSNRPYRKAFSKEQTVEEIIKHKGTQFDPRVVDAFVRVILRD